MPFGKSEETWAADEEGIEIVFEVLESATPNRAGLDDADDALFGISDKVAEENGEPLWLEGFWLSPKPWPWFSNCDCNFIALRLSRFLFLSCFLSWENSCGKRFLPCFWIRI